MLSPRLREALDERRPPAREVGAVEVEGEAVPDTPVVIGVSSSESETTVRRAMAEGERGESGGVDGARAREVRA